MYQVNTRVWLTEPRALRPPGDLDDIPDAELDQGLPRVSIDLAAECLADRAEAQQVSRTNPAWAP
ncbi:MAG: hypothetical protein U0872_08990 [Planctomycetaceae bacterium]